MQRAKRSHSPRSSKPNTSSSKKYRSAGQIAGVTSSTTSSSSNITSSTTMLGENRFNPSTRTPSTNIPYPLPPYGKTTTATTMDDRSSVSDNDSVHSPRNETLPGLGHHGVMGSTDDKPKPAPGKKTRGRVKIEMQYIQNKLRRYTTFSKRKSGIMKKAYELSTLTGTQVMLLVASETGHVYTFATPKLQPMITSEAGKALIQTCLHTPDPPQQPMDYDIRMSATGYEETELGYGLSDEEAFKTGLEGPTTGHPGPQVLTSGSVVIPPGMMQMPFTAQVAHADHHQSMVMPPSAYSMAVSSGPTMSPHSHSPPPSYSPSAHTTNSPRNYPNSPPTIAYSQSSHLPPQHMIMEDLVPNSGSPLRKSPSDTHYLSHHHYDRSPSHSPMTAQFPMRTHSPPHQIYSNSSPAHHSPIGPM